MNKDTLCRKCYRTIYVNDYEAFCFGCLQKYYNNSNKTYYDDKIDTIDMRYRELWNETVYNKLISYGLYRYTKEGFEFIV